MCISICVYIYIYIYGQDPCSALPTLIDLAYYRNFQRIVATHPQSKYLNVNMVALWILFGNQQGWHWLAVVPSACLTSSPLSLSDKRLLTLGKKQSLEAIVRGLSFLSASDPCKNICDMCVWLSAWHISECQPGCSVSLCLETHRLKRHPWNLRNRVSRTRTLFQVREWIFSVFHIWELYHFHNICYGFGVFC